MREQEANRRDTRDRGQSESPARERREPRGITHDIEGYERQQAEPEHQSHQAILGSEEPHRKALSEDSSKPCAARHPSDRERDEGTDHGTAHDVDRAEEVAVRRSRSQRDGGAGQGTDHNRDRQYPHQPSGTQPPKIHRPSAQRLGIVEHSREVAGSQEPIPDRDDSGRDGQHYQPT